MGNLINLAVYNPAILDDNEFLEGFVARRELAGRLMNRLREVTSSNLARHLLIIGQRGMGKTSMLRRLALGVAQEPALAEILIPLTFREEQYNVHNLHVFWCNCLDALGDYLEKHGRRDLADQLDREIGKLASAGGDPGGNAACQLFKEWCAKEGKRPLLLVDNIDLIFGGLKERQQWGLRRILQERGGVVMVGASAGLLEAVVKNEAPFYDFFQVHQLEKLSHQELLSCLRQIALKRGEAGVKVIKVLDDDPARIQTLYDLTGGNPRTLVLLYLLLELDSEGDVMDDLERLLDQVTALYKARVEDLAPQTRVVLDAVALAWNPVTVAGVAADTGIEATSVSSQFDRLIKMGILEKVSLSTPAPAGYQLGERFFNIWYLMRNASRRMRNRLRWLTEFLRRLYTPQQLSTLADDFIRRSREKTRCSGVYGLALSDALEDGNLRHAMNHHLTRQFMEQAETLRRQVDTLVERSDLDQTTLNMAEMKKRVLECERDWGNTSAEEFWDLVGGSFVFLMYGKMLQTSWLKMASVEELESVVEDIRKTDEVLKQASGLPETFDCLRQALREGMIESISDLAHALAAAKEYNSPELPLLMIAFSTDKYLKLSSDVGHSLIDYIRSYFQDSANIVTSTSCCHWARFLAQNGLTVEAEQALQKAIELDPKDSLIWNYLGNLFQDHLNRPLDAEAAYRKAIEINGASWVAKSNLAYILLSQTEKMEEAEAVYTDAINFLPKPGKQILTAFRAIARDNFGEAKENLLQALEISELILSTMFEKDFLKVIRLAKKRAYGEKLLSFMKEVGLDERKWPLYAAFDAYMNGEEKLRDINPEVRGAARRIFDWLISTPEEKEMRQDTGKKKGRRMPRKR